MAPPDEETQTTRRTGMPELSSIVAEKTLTAPSPVRRAYRIIQTNEMDPYDRPLDEPELAAAGRDRFAGFGDDFRGRSRRAAKLSIADAPVETFGDLSDLIASLPSEGSMADHDPPITTEADSERVEEENRNVRVRTFLYAASRENDNDFHLILGRDPSREPMYMTMEISGLPPSESEHFATLKEARDAYKEFFADDLPGASYDFYDPPIPVEIEGSLFFDMNHVTGSRPGPASLRDHIPTIWEVHSITRIVFEP